MVRFGGNMDFQAKKARVQAQTYSTRSGEQDAGLNALASESRAVDNRLLELLKSINSESDQEFSFSQLLADQLDKIGYDLREAHQSIVNLDSLSLDSVAQNLTRNVLKVGAVKMLSSAIEIQNLARLGDFCAAEKILGDLEVELLSVRSELS